MRKFFLLLLILFFVSANFSNVIAQISKIEPNNNFATSQPIASLNKFPGNFFPKPVNNCSSITAIAGVKVYMAGISTYSSSATTGAHLRIVMSDGITVMEFNEDEGSNGFLELSIPAAAIPGWFVSKKKIIKN